MPWAQVNASDLYYQEVGQGQPLVLLHGMSSCAEAWFQQFEAFFGFKEDPDVPALLEECGRRGYPFDMMDTSFFVSRETLIATVAPGMALWRERLFVSMSKNATKASEFFNVPTNRVVELGTQVEL